MSRADRGLREGLRYAVILVPVAVIAIVAMQAGVQHLRPGRPPRALEFLGLTGSLLVCVSSAAAVWRLRLRGAEAWPIAGWAIAMLSVLRVAPFVAMEYDFGAYRHAAEAIAAGATPYPDPVYYTYPPLLAEFLGAIASAAARFGTPPSADFGWYVVFAVIQLCQVIAVAVVYAALYRGARSFGLSETVSALLVAGLLVVNEPLALTLANSQMNFIMLAMVMAAVMLEARVAMLAGLGLAVPTVIKLYPATLLPAWWLNGRRRAALWAVLWIGALVAVTRPWTLWVEFVRLWMRPAHYPTVGDSTLFNLLANGARFLGVSPHDMPARWIRPIWIAAVACVALWSVRRVIARWKAAGASSSSFSVLFACTAEILALNLFVSPLVWPHHFVFALPLAVFAAASEGARRPILIGTSLILTFALPWSDVFLLGYHRLIGVALALYATSPRQAAAE
jgi:hypothetical protein